MKKELSVLGIEAYDIWLQHIDGEIRRELWNVFAVELRITVPKFARHEVCARTLNRRCEDPAASAQTRAPAFRSSVSR